MTWLLGIVIGILGVAGVVAAAIAVVRANLATATISAYAADNDALRGRVDTLVAQRDELVQEQARCHGRITALENEKQLLADMVTGRSAVQKLEQTVIAQHTDMLEGLDKVVEALAVLAATGQLRNPRKGP